MFNLDNNANDNYNHWEYAPSEIFGDNGVANGFFMSQILKKIFWRIKNIMIIIIIIITWIVQENLICDLKFELQVMVMRQQVIMVI